MTHQHKKAISDNDRSENVDAVYPMPRTALDVDVVKPHALDNT